jgi:hypothetical protein
MKTRWKLVIAAAVMTFLLAGIGAVAVVGRVVLANVAQAQMFSEAGKFCELFEDAIAHGQLEEAYQLCSRDFKRKTSLEDLRNMVARAPALIRPDFLEGPNSLSTEMSSDPAGKRVLCQTSVTNIKGAVTYTVILGREGGAWSVDDFQVQK